MSNSEVKKMMWHVVGKNPLSVLHEYCQLHNIRPLYVVDDEEGSPHCKIFTISCIVSDMKTTGVGKSKREATFNAATNMVELLQASSLMDIKNFGDIRQGPSKRMKLIEVTSSSKITENPVGFLQEYCVAQRMSVPSYTQEPTQLGYSVICTVNNFSCTGAAEKKKIAKTFAAKQMCEILLKKKNEINNNENKNKKTEGEDQHIEAEDRSEEVVQAEDRSEKQFKQKTD